MHFDATLSCLVCQWWSHPTFLNNHLLIRWTIEGLCGNDIYPREWVMTVVHFLPSSSGMMWCLLQASKTDLIVPGDIYIDSIHTSTSTVRLGFLGLFGTYLHIAIQWHHVTCSLMELVLSSCLIWHLRYPPSNSCNGGPSVMGSGCRWCSHVVECATRQ